jgi:uncharacterized protein YigE (DUF2233 family)
MNRTLSFALILIAGPALAVTCEDVMYEGLSYTTCTVDPAAERLELLLYDDIGIPFGDFATLEQAYEGRSIPFAMNAGMYHPDRSPVGLFIVNGTEVSRLLTGPSDGNFGMLPNGVLCIRPGQARVFETLVFEQLSSTCDFATQSGPMLVIDGALHPRFLPDSTSRFVRNGVGTTDNGDRAVFAISNQPVTFYEFARFFRDGLGLPLALYFDGNVSQLHAPALGRSDRGRAMGPIVAVIE